MTDPHDVATARSQAGKSRKKAGHDAAVKEREFYRYYPQHPNADEPLSPQPSPSPALDAAQTLPPDDTPQSSDDKSLTAFAQLGALRLNTRRCLISFFDRRDCHLLAEATRTLSLRTGEPEFESDRLCWGNTMFPKEKSICYYTVNLATDYIGLDYYDGIPSLIINDLRKDDRFKHYPFVEGPPYSRFYAGVPIRSPSGHNIGTYCVLDSEPRDGVSPCELRFLKDMAVVVMRHLEMTRATEDYRRGKIMVKSLGLFAEGKSGLEHWWQDPWESEQPPATTLPENLPAQHQRPAARSNASQQPFGPHRSESVESSLPSVTGPSAATPTSLWPASIAATPTSDPLLDGHVPDVTVKTAASASGDQKDNTAPELRATFNRAANMIVDATEADGAVFFDAKISTFGGLVDDDVVSEQLPEPDKPCVLLGAALSKNSWGAIAPTESEYSMSESVLRHLLRSYSHGQIFNFDDDDGAPAINSPSGGGELDFRDGFPFTVSRKSDSTRSIDDEVYLRSLFPKARRLVLYPLWDRHRHRWFACAVIWSSDPMRIFTNEQELSYLAAFSTSVMAEIARLDTKRADAAKADFISSISHELRSPLHGILGMTDLLKDSSLDDQQTSHTATIETCGKTLLETINHVLDFAKINNLTRGALNRQEKRTPSGKHMISSGQAHTNDIMTLINDVDMSILTEDVVESVFAGYTYAKTSAHTYELGTSQLDMPSISVILDINHSTNYVFRTQPGAWRRVIMNLFGNSLKYTPAGYIKIKLEVKKKKDAADERCDFRFTVTDSGIGMSQNYINTRLFHSFAQENPLSQGTGLGLSIVKQIVESLGGNVEVRSEKGRGTKFTVSCPLKESSISPGLGAVGLERDKELQLQEIHKRTKGMKVRLVGFSAEEEYFAESLKSKTATKLSLKALTNLCTEWFGLQRCDNGESAAEPDLVIATETGAKHLRAQYSQDLKKASRAPVIVVCQGAASAQSMTAITTPGIIFECIAQPVGPHKMAKALSSCLDRHASRPTAQTIETDSSLPKLTQLSLKENTPPHSPDRFRVLEDSRPHLASLSSAPELRSIGSNSTKRHIYSKPSRPLNCLCVDDNPINLRLIRTFVDKLGHRHVLAINGLEALNHYKAVHTSLPSADEAARFDVVLMDINMPVMDGLEATRQIRAHEIRNSLPKVTIIALTGVADTDIQQEANLSGINLFLIKPVRLAQLEVILQGVVTGQDTAKLELEEEKGRLRNGSVVTIYEGSEKKKEPLSVGVAELNGTDATHKQVKTIEPIFAPAA